MLTRVGPGSNGYNFQTEFIFWDCVVLLAPGATLATGQVVMRDVTAFPNMTGADHCVLPTSANAGPVYGVYQGPPITNGGTVATEYAVIVMREGYGQVLANGATAVTVGGFVLIGVALQATGGAAEGNANTQIGIALATGIVTAKGATILAAAGNIGLVNCAIAVLG